jgi:integrase
MLDRYTFELELMAKKDKPENFLTAKLIERVLGDGSKLRMENVDASTDEDRKVLGEWLGIQNQPAKLASDDGRTLGAMVKAYKEHAQRADSWTAKTAQEVGGILDLMLEVIGENAPLARLSRKDFVSFKEVLMELPANRTKSPLYRDKSVLELRGMKIPADHRMSVTTMNKILTWAASAAEWGTKHDYLPANYAEGLKLPKTKRDSEHREPYTDEEVLKMKDALLTGAHGADEYPWRRWLPLLLAYSGARLNEMAQLRVQDVVEIDVIPAITITAEAGRLKTQAAARTIPVHPELLRLGFMDYVAKMRKRGAARLFPELPQKRRDGPGHAVGRWWGDTYRHKIGLAHRDLHSLRHTVATKLREADVPEDVLQELQGWARGTSEGFRRYAKASTQTRLLAALSKLSYGDTPAATPSLRLVSGG